MPNEHLHMIGHSAPIFVQSYIEMHKGIPDTRHNITRYFESNAPHHMQHHQGWIPLPCSLSQCACESTDTFGILSRSRILPKIWYSNNLYMIIEMKISLCYF